MSAADDYVAIHEALISKALTAYEERLQALELAADSADSSLVEALRQDRWWATYNAALQSYSLYELGEEEMGRRCRAFADRAHGPLVRPLVAAAGAAIDPKLFAQGGRFMYTVDAQAHNALIEAARLLTDSLAGRIDGPTSNVTARESLEDALKPFER